VLTNGSQNSELGNRLDADEKEHGEGGGQEPRELRSPAEPVAPEMEQSAGRPTSEPPHVESQWEAQATAIDQREAQRAWMQERIQSGDLTGLRAELAQLGQEEITQIVRNLRVWPAEIQAPMVDLLIEREDALDVIAEEMQNLPGVDGPSVGRTLLARRGGYAGTLAIYPASFQIDQLEIIDTLANGDRLMCDFLAACISQFEPRYHCIAAVKLLLSGVDGIVSLLNKFEQFSGLDRGWFASVLDTVWPFRKRISKGLLEIRSGAGEHCDGAGVVSAEGHQSEGCPPKKELDYVQRLVAEGSRLEIVGCLDMFHPCMRPDVRCLYSDHEGNEMYPPSWTSYSINRPPESVLSLSQAQEEFVILEAAREMLILGNEHGAHILLADCDISTSTFETFIRQSLGLQGAADTFTHSVEQQPSSDDLYRTLLDVVREIKRLSDLVLQDGIHDIAERLISAVRTIPSGLRSLCVHYIFDELLSLDSGTEDRREGIIASPSAGAPNSHVAPTNELISEFPSVQPPADDKDRIVHECIRSLMSCSELVDGSIISHMLRAGGEQHVIANLDVLSEAMSAESSVVFSLVAAFEIRRGYFARAVQILGEAGVSLESFVGYLAGEIPQHERDGDLRSLLSLAGWLSLNPALGRHLERAGVMSTFERYLDIFAPQAVGSSESPSVEALSQRHADVEQMVRQGLPLLEELRWLTAKHLSALFEMLPQFLRQGASTGEAWRAHRANLLEGKAPFLKSAKDIRFELGLLLSFHRAFPFLRLPIMYQAFRNPPPVGWEVRAILETRMIDERYEVLNRVVVTSLREIEGVAEYKPGSDGVMALLKQLLRTRQEELLAEDFHSESGLIELQTELLAALIGSRDARVIAQRVALLGAGISEGTVAPKDVRFQPQRFSVKRLDLEQLTTFQFSKDTKDTYARFLRVLDDVKGRSAHAIALHARRAALSLLAEKKSGAERALQALSEDRARASIEADLRRVRTATSALNKAHEPVSILKSLCDFSVNRRKADPDIAPLIQQVALPLVLQDMPSAGQFIDGMESTPSKVALEWIRELVNRALVDEALGPMGLSEEQTKVAVKSFGINPFEFDAARLAAVGTRGSEVLSAHPTRGVLGELSGFNCQSCWTRYDRLMERYPNVTAIMFVKSPDDVERVRLVGACMVIKARDLVGDEVFVIRGINPILNFITNVSAESFFESFVDEALVPMAQAQGVRKIVIPRDGLFEAQTNRPSLHGYIVGRYGGAPAVALDRGGPETTFNDYEIWDRCVLVREL